MAAIVQCIGSGGDREMLVEDALANIYEYVAHVVGRRRGESRFVDSVLLLDQRCLYVIKETLPVPPMYKAVPKFVSLNACRPVPMVCSSS